MSTEYLDKLYESTFEAVHDALLEMARKDPMHAMHHTREVLKSLYVRQGNDWSGRGVVGDTSIDASIAAHEAILAELASRADAGRTQGRRTPGRTHASRTRAERTHVT